MALNYRPPVYMWIATYEDGQALPQFDPETGKENRFARVDLSRVVKIGWYPILEEMAAKILQGSRVVTIPRKNPVYEINLKEGQMPYIRRTTVIPPGTFRKCLECGARWIFSFGKPDPQVERQGYHWHSDHKFIDMGEGKTYRVAVCPSCGFHNMPSDKPEEKRIIRRSKDMSYALYKLGVEDGPYFLIDEAGEVLNQ